MVSVINRMERSERSCLYAEDYGTDLEDKKGQVYITLRIIKDRSERKSEEEAFNKIEEKYRKEIQHRIKNNLQIISSLLSLQANYFKDPEVLEAFGKTRKRVISMALIHEELYKSENQRTVDFTACLWKLTEELFSSYGACNSGVRLQMDAKEPIFLDMDTAIPLGMIVNELVTNSLKHAFSSCPGGEIKIRFYRMRTNSKAEDLINNDQINNDQISDNRINNDQISDNRINVVLSNADLSNNDRVNEDKINYITKNSINPGNFENSRFTLIVSDNGSGFSEDINFENPDTLGLQLVKTLVEQINGKIELRRGHVTEVKIEFYDCIL